MKTQNKDILSTKEERKIKEGGKEVTLQEPHKVLNNSQEIFFAWGYKERNDGMFQAYNKNGEKLFFAITKERVQELITT